MKKYSKEDALEEIFYNNENPLSAKLLVYKHRYKNGSLSQKSIDEILKEFNFVIYQQTLYTKN